PEGIGRELRPEGTGRERRLLLIGPLPPPYHGVAVYTELVLKHGLGEGIRLISLDTMNRAGTPAAGRATAGNFAFGTKCILRFLYLMISQRPDWVHLPISQSFWGFLRDGMIILASRAFRRSVSIHLHGSALGELYDSSGRLTRAFMRFALRRTAGAVVLGECLRGIFDGLLPPDRVRVATNGVDGAPPAGRVRAAIERRKSLPVRRIVYLGGLTVGKGVPELLRAAAIVSARRRDMEFRLAGWYPFPEERATLEREMARAREAGVNLAFDGVLAGRDKFEWLLKADMFVFPAVQREGLPLAILEAFACGVPVLATPQGAIPEVLSHGESGELVAAGDVEALAAAIERLAADRDDLARMGMCARAAFERRHTAEACCRELRSALAGLAGW
ncbi:MAG: glycosyltransferase family 4 protein, partial [Planctomycetota bacterium]|nr:glycosyltransferase family 4 protein [Planctomycetota bacterium]